MQSLFSILIGFVALALTACGNNKIEVSALPQFRYFVESKFTGQVENTLVVEGTDIGQMSFKLSGHGFTADVPLDKEIPVQARTKFQYIEVGDYIVNVQFFKADGTPLLQDSLKWSFSLESPQNPIVGFASNATNDARVVLLIAESRDPTTNEIWVEGDLANEMSPLGMWRPIPTTSKLPIRLTEADGMKQLKVKLRNSFKNETELKTIQILKKSQGPINCRVDVKGLGTVNRYFEINVAGENDGPIFYRVFGDAVEPFGFQEFTAAGTKVPIKLTAGAGTKFITVQIRDVAENYCLQQDLEITSDPSYAGEGLRIKDAQVWTDSNQVVVEPWIDRFEGDTIEMYVHGDIVDDDATFQWVAWKPELTVTLQPTDGTRWVRVQYRINGELTSFRFASVYLKPNIIILPGTDTPYRLVVAEIISLESLTITGCTQTYSQLAFAASFKCTPSGPTATVLYKLKDGTSFSKSASFPP